jgi:hypothetical protein
VKPKNQICKKGKENFQKIIIIKKLLQYLLRGKDKIIGKISNLKHTTYNSICKIMGNGLYIKFHFAKNISKGKSATQAM